MAIRWRSSKAVWAAWLGAALALTPAIVQAAPPTPAGVPGADEKAREALAKARAARNDARSFDKRADEKRAAAKLAAENATKEIRGLEAQADAKEAEAKRWYAQAGRFALNEMKADILRVKAKNLMAEYTNKTAEADRYAASKESAKTRAAAQRASAAALLANNPDFQMKADAAELIKLAEANEKEVIRLQGLEDEVRKKANAAKIDADSALREANKIDPDGT